VQLDARRSAEEQEGFGSQLRRYRVLAGLSQEALAERAGISRRGIADLERGARRSPYPDTASRLAAGLELGAEERAAFMAACRPRRTGSTRRYTLQIEPSTFVGRQRELAEISQLVAGSRVLTLTGTGGIGKTRIALELARQLESEYADGAVFIDLAQVYDPAHVPQAVAATLGVSARLGESVTDSVREHLQPRRVLLVLDNCEHVVAACAQLADVLIRASSSLQLVITSREPLRIHGETVWVVTPLAADEAVALFTQQAQAAAATNLSSADLDRIGEICSRRERIPLAIELAAVRAPALGVADVADLLADRLDFLVPRPSSRLAAAPDAAGGARLQLQLARFPANSVYSYAWLSSPAVGTLTLRGPCARRATRRHTSSWMAWRAWSTSRLCLPKTLVGGGGIAS
jgi:transcriptional regulator with XRE-family HTH domain